MKTKRFTRWLALLLIFALIAAACGDSDDDTSGSTTTTTAEADDSDAGSGDGTTGGDDDDAADSGEEMAVSLEGVCPNPLVIQSDWFPESEHGAIYELIGDDYVIDADNKVVGGSMVLGGEDLGIDVEIRAGGPAVGSQPVVTLMTTDDDITLGYGSTDSQILRFDTAPLLSVLAPLEQNPQIVMWDPETYPDVESIADLGELGVTIQVFSAGTWSEVLAGLGVISSDQIDPSYDGSPARFIAEGDIAQQGFASAEPFSYEFKIEEYMRPVGFQLLSDAGFEPYTQTIAILPERLDELRPCLTELVPIIQQATVNYYASPDRANGIIVDAVVQYETFWNYEADLAEFSVQAQLDLGLVGNGGDGIVGNMDLDRVERVIESIRIAGLEVPENLTAADLVTNEFIDETIGF